MRGGEGAEVIYSLRNDSKLAEKILNNLAQAGQKVRKYYQKRLPSNSSKDYYYILRNTPNTEALIVEYGFIDNKIDAEKLKKNYKKYAESVVKAVLEYKGLDYKINEKDNTYTVKKGDTLWTISKNTGITVADLKKFNNLTSNLLVVGQVLSLTGALPEGIEYIVKAGDTLYELAKMNNTTVENLKVFNNLKSDILKTGQKIKLPTFITEKKVNNKYDTYKVKMRDTLYAIANLYKISVNELKMINNLESDVLTVNQEIKVPIKSKDNVYTVVKGILQQTKFIK